MKLFSIFDEIKKKKELNRLIESTVVEIDTINEALKIGNDYLKADIFIYQNEGNIPHFHVKFNGHESCFCLFESKYYNHELYHVMMNDDHLFGLNVFLMSPTKESNIKRNWWEYLVGEWVRLHTNQDYEHKSNWRNIKKPDYRETKLNKYQGKNNNCTKRY